MITFVSAFFPFRETPYFDKKENAPSPYYLFDLIQTGIQLCLFVAHDCPFLSLFQEWALAYPHFRIMPHYLTTWQNTRTGQSLMENQGKWSLPANRNMEKDTVEFITWTHSRIDLIDIVASLHPFFGVQCQSMPLSEKSQQSFVWIESQLPQLFHNKDNTLAYLGSQFLHDVETRLPHRNAIYLPGCLAQPWNDGTKSIDLTQSVHWRFCGGFSVFATMEAVHAMYYMYRMEWDNCLKQKQCLLWDVNFLAYIESRWKSNFVNIQLIWYRADNNDSIVHVVDGISADTYAICPFAKHGHQRAIPCPTVASSTFPYHASSMAIAFVPLDKDNWMWNEEYRTLFNIRYVNYQLGTEGQYLFSPQSNHVIHNQNVCISNWQVDKDNNVEEPTQFVIMDQTDARMANGELLPCPLGKTHRYMSEGFEDIRLFTDVHDPNKVYFIATTVNYSPVGRGRMVIGEYDWMNGTYKNCQCILPPDAQSWCEKNWIPFRLKRNLNQYFIYRWSPFEFGYVNEDGKLEIVCSFAIHNGLFRSIRGSSTFQRYTDAYDVGVVHFSEEHRPRHYFHVLVLLDKETGVPCRHSDVFYFESLSVEFCTAFLYDATKDTFSFWISRMDRDPCQWTIDCCHLPFKHAVHSTQVL